MTTVIVLLRGINVGGNNRILMAELRAALARLFLARLRRPVAANDAPAVEPPGGEKQCG